MFFLLFTTDQKFTISFQSYQKLIFYYNNIHPPNVRMNV